MSRKKAEQEYDMQGYKTGASARATTPEGYPVFCAYDKLVPIEELVPNPKNPNMHPSNQVKMLGAIIKANGWRQPITVSTRSGFIVKGHGRYEAAKAIGSTVVPVDYQEYATEAEEYADLTADNRIAEMADMNTSMLADILQELDTGEVPLEMTGYTEEDLQGILDALSGADDTENNHQDADGTPAKAAITKPGDIWTLGRHRLICGDSTKEETLQRLMGSERAQMVNTDPPYGVSYEDQSGKFGMIQNDDLTQDNLMAGLLIPAFNNMVRFTKPDAAFYIWHASSTRRDFEDAMTAAGIMEKQYIIWVKTAPVLGHADYQWAHEPCFYAEKSGQSCAFFGDRSQRTTWKVVLRGEDEMATVLTGGIAITDGSGGHIFIQENPPKGKKVRYLRLQAGNHVELYGESKGASTVWEVSRDTNYEHPTQKPVELAVRAIQNSTEEGDIVLDIFGGAGFTLLGAEQTGRQARVVETEPKYCDVIVSRYFRMTNNAGITVLRNGKEIMYTALSAEARAIADETAEQDADDQNEAEDEEGSVSDPEPIVETEETAAKEVTTKEKKTKRGANVKAVEAEKPHAKKPKAAKKTNKARVSKGNKR
jgi:DNA modification methylase